MDEIKLSGLVRNNQRLSGEINSEQELLGILNRGSSGSAKEFFYINAVWNSNESITITDQDMTLDKIIQAVDSGLFPIMVVDVSEIISGGGMGYVYYKFDCVNKSNKFLLFSTLINYDPEYLNRTVDTIKIYEDNGSLIINTYSSIRSFINSLISTAITDYYTKEEVDDAVNTCVPKLTSTTQQRAYVQNNGKETSILVVNSQAFPSSIAQRTNTGQIFTAETPTANGHAASKKYVDDHAKDYILYGTNQPTISSNNFAGQIYVRSLGYDFETDKYITEIYACHYDAIETDLTWIKIYPIDIPEFKTIILDSLIDGPNIELDDYENIFMDCHERDALNLASTATILTNCTMWLDLYFDSGGTFSFNDAVEFYFTGDDCTNGHFSITGDPYDGRYYKISFIMNHNTKYAHVERWK